MSKKKKNKSPKKNENLSPVDKRDAKKAAVLGTGKKNRLPFFIILMCIILAVGSTIFYIFNNSENIPFATAETSVTDQALSNAQTDVVTYPISLFGDGLARHFSHKDGDVTIKYFILKSSDGFIRAAFDACDVCWPAGKGYYQDGDYMVCRNCGRRFASVLVNEVKGGCNPAPLNRTVKDGQVVIQVKDILEGRQYFDFSQRT